MPLRFHWFVPLRKKTAGGEKAVPGPVRRLLRRLGPTWAASPARRLAQTGCLLLFLALFFWVCWPYTARPAAEWRGWIPVEVDTVTGQITLANDQLPEPPILPDSAWYVVEEDDQGDRSFGRFRVVGSGDSELTLVPVDGSAGGLEQMAMSLGPWSLSSRDPSHLPSHYADDLTRKQVVPVPAFLALDPLVSLSAGIASRSWIWSLVWAGVIVGVCLAIPRGFCGYVCPFGTLIDLFDWAVGRRISGFRVSREGWWGGLRYGLLTAVLAAAFCGVLFAGFVAAIPVLTRGMALVFAPLQDGVTQGWQQMPPYGAGQWLSIAMFFGVLALGLLGPRFWCRYVCPTGAVFSLGSVLRLHQRHVSDACAGCGRCAEHCPFDAVEPGFGTRTADCAFCQTCGGVCPTEAVRFSSRWSRASNTANGQAGAKESSLPRRRFLASGISLGAGCLGGLGAAVLVRLSGPAADAAATAAVRPPGSVPEIDFLRMCVGCGQCLRACPNGALQPLGVGHGLESLWTPHLVADWAGCETSCNRCGQVCPTGAIRALPLIEKQAARMGRAVVDQATCLPFAQRASCRLCVDACAAAGHRAIEFVRVGTELDASGRPIADTGYLVPSVQEHRCVGCGQCQTRCHAINVDAQGALTEAAIRVKTGQGKEDRLRSGSYIALREAEAAQQQENTLPPASSGEYLPDFLR